MITFNYVSVNSNLHAFVLICCCSKHYYCVGACCGKSDPAPVVLHAGIRIRRDVFFDGGWSGRSSGAGGRSVGCFTRRLSRRLLRRFAAAWRKLWRHFWRHFGDIFGDVVYDGCAFLLCGGRGRDGLLLHTFARGHTHFMQLSDELDHGRAKEWSKMWSWATKKASHTRVCQRVNVGACMCYATLHTITHASRAHLTRMHLPSFDPQSVIMMHKSRMHDAVHHFMMNWSLMTNSSRLSLCTTRLSHLDSPTHCLLCLYLSFSLFLPLSLSLCFSLSLSFYFYYFCYYYYKYYY